MTDYYVSQTATNGYAIGVDTNDGLSKSAPLLTYGKAVKSAAIGDTIIFNDGVYLSTDGPEGSAYPIWTKPAILQAENQGLSKILTTSAYAIYINPAASGIFKIDGMVLDAGGEFTGVAINNTAFDIEIDISNTAINNFMLRGFSNVETDPVSITLSDVSMTTVSSRNDVEIFSSGNIASGNITIDGLTLDITQGGSAGAINGLKFLSTTGTGSTLYVNNISGTINGNGITGSQITPGLVYIENFQAYEVVDIDIDFLDLDGTYGVFANEDSTGGLIHNIKMRMDWQSGYGVLARSEDTEVHDCDIQNANTDQTKTPHGIVIGYDNPGSAQVVKARVYNNKVSGFCPSYHAVNAGNDVIFFLNFAYNCYGNYVYYSKGCVGTKFYNNTNHASTGYNGNAFGMQTFDPTGVAVHSADVEWLNNICFNSSASPIFLFTDANQTGIFANNRYYASESLISSSWQYGGVDYATFAAWQTANETTATWGDPMLSITGKITKLSPAVKTGIDLSVLYGVRDMWGKYPEGPYNVGADQGAGTPKRGGGFGMFGWMG